MKKILLTASAISVASLASPALAESSDTATINMTGNVEQICTAVPRSNIAGSNLVGQIDYSTSDDTVNVLFDFKIANTDDPTASSIGQTSQAFFSVAFATFCNDDFTISATPTNGSFDNTASAPTGFTNTLPYGYTLKKLQVGSVSAGNAAPRTLSGPAFQGTSQIDFNVKPSTVAPVAGDYSETMTVLFSADA